MLAKALMPLAERLDRKFGWHRLPYYVGLATLVGLRERLRQRNLYDTGVPVVSDPEPAAARKERLPEGTFNDLAQPGMGSIRAPFGRNAPALPDPDPLGAPHPREVSDALMARARVPPREPPQRARRRVAAVRGPRLAQPRQGAVDRRLDARRGHAAGEGDPHARLGPHELPLPRDALVGRVPALRQPRAVHRPTSRPATARSSSTTRCSCRSRRRRGPRTRPRRACGSASPCCRSCSRASTTRSCGGCARSTRTGTATRLYAKARLINSALMAKIHTVEWTPAIIGHPTTERAIKATWWGLLGRDARNRFGRIGEREILSGIPGSRTEHHGVPYTLTEEFVTVYRLHPLMPDEFTFGSPELRPARARDPARPVEPAARPHRRGRRRRRRAARARDRAARPDRAVQLPRDDAPLGADRRAPADRPRRRRHRPLARAGRAALHRVPPAAADAGRRRRFEELAGGNARTAAKIREVYEGDLDAVDAVVGLYAEPKPHGLRVQRDRVPDLPADGLTAPAERPLLHRRLHAGDLHAGRAALDRGDVDGRRHPPPLPGAARRAENAFKRWPASTGP